MKKFVILLLVAGFMFVSANAFATPPGHNFGPPGFYQKVNGANAGEIKYFKNGHPGDPSEWVYIGPTPGGECPNGCGFAQNYFSGDSNQYSGANLNVGNLEFDDDNMYVGGNGAAGFGEESASASYYGNGNGLGFALTLGATGFYGGKFTYGFDNGKGVGVVGATGNIAAAGVFADGPGCAKINGNGTLATFAAGSNKIGAAVASSNGSFNYTGATPSGVVIGGGITAGGSVVGGGDHHVFAASGQLTVSGVGSMNLGGYDN